MFGFLLAEFRSFVRWLIFLIVAAFSVLLIFDLGRPGVIPNFLADPVQAGVFQEETLDLDGFSLSSDSTTTADPANSQADKISFDFKQDVRVWFGYQPSNFPDKRPAIVLLHGSGRDGLVMIDMWKTIAEKEGLVLIAPSSSNPRGWGLKTDGPEFLEAVIDQAIKKYPVDINKIYLFGHSGGAVFGQRLLATPNLKWKASSLHAGYLAAKKIRATKSKIPLQFLLGELDKNFGTPGGRASAKAMAELGHDTEFVSILKHGHWYYTEATKINARAWEFFRQY